MRFSRIVALVAFVSVAAVAQAQPASRAALPSQSQMAAMSGAQFSAFLGAIPAEHRLAGASAPKPDAPCPWTDNNGIIAAMMSFFGGMFGRF